MASLTLQICLVAINLPPPAVLADVPSMATDPAPADGASGIAADVALRWKPGKGRTGHRVYLGTTPPGLYRGTQAEAVFQAHRLLAGATYYWRVDEIGSDGPITGNVWCFTTRPVRIAGDLNTDGSVKIDDFERFQECLAGPGITIVKQECVTADFDADQDADIQDLRAFVERASAPAQPDPAPGHAAPAAIGPIPPRSTAARTGGAIVAEMLNATPDQRETRIREEITSGNMPSFLRCFVPVTVTAATDGRSHTIIYEVAPDYLAIGSDTDFVRMPMTPQSAQIIADRFECILPTRKMVNDTYAQAAVRLAPSPINPRTIDITHVGTFYLHQLQVEEQRVGWPLGALVAGIKKDVVVTPQLTTRPGKVAIYGWHRLDGQPIQPLYLGHTRRWVDYSQCIRLVKGYANVDGKIIAIADVLNNPALCTLLSDEGTVADPRYPE